MELFKDMHEMDHEQVVFCQDRSTGLKAIIAIHSTTLGPALGGCRMWDYASEQEAITDVLRLSRGMTYKAAVAGLNLGGGKAVIIGDPKKLKSEAFFRSFGRFVRSLGGRYITAEDVNINVQDVENIGTETKFVTGIKSRPGGSGDPSPVTALGVYSGIRAAVQHKLGLSSLKGLTIAVQGCGAVGSYLCKHLNDEGAKLVVTDIDASRANKIADLYGARVVADADIFAVQADVFAPCALGAIINEETIPQLKVKVIAGGANNQLRNDKIHGKQLSERGILYAPDYVINAGGLINVYSELQGYDQNSALSQARGIYDTLLRIFKEADDHRILTHEASDRLAEKRISALRATPSLSNTVENQTWVHSRFK